MAFEIERKFLVEKELIPEAAENFRIIQAYLCIDPERTIRIRIAADKAYLTIKGRSEGNSRREYEYRIPPDDARELLALTVSTPVEKVRKEIYVGGKKWEVDFFEGANRGLILAEIELSTEEEDFIKPDWVKEEVSGDMRYQNSQLSVNPYTKW